MNRLSALFLSALISFSALAQSTQPCVVKQYNQKEEKTPLPGVEVMVSNAGSTVSDNAGKLTLSFRTLKPGDKVNLVSAKKNGFELMNTDAVSQWNISTDQRPFELVMVNSEYFAQLKSRLKQTSTESYKSKYEKAVKEVEALKKAAKISEEDYYSKLDELETQYMNSLKNIDTYIDQFARIDLSEVSAEEQRILEMVEEGRIDEAVEAYGALDISGKLRQARENKKALALAKAKIEEEEVGQEIAIKELKEKQRREISTLKLAGGKENYNKIGLMLKENALADTTDVDAVFEYAEYSYNQHDYAESERFYLMAFDIFTALFNKDPDVYRYSLASTLNNLGILYNDLHDYAKSEEYYLKALDNKIILFTQNPDAYRADLASTQNNLGILYSDLLEYTKSEEYFLKALENKAVLFSQNPDAYRADLASTQNNLGSLYFYLHSYAKSEEYLLKALENRILLFNQNADAYRADLASTQHNLGALYYDLSAYDKSEEYYLKALENRLQLFNQNPDAYRADIASTQYNLGGLYYFLYAYAKSEEYFLNALENYNQLFGQNPDAYRVGLSMTQYGLGTLYSDIHDNAKAEEYYLKALENKTVLFEQHPDAYRADLARTQYKLGVFFFDIRDYTKSEAYYLKAVENYKVLFEESPNTYRTRLAWIQYSLMHIYAKDGYPVEKYDSMLDAALTNCEELFKEDSVYQPMIVELLLRKGIRALEDEKTDEALAIFESVYLLAPEESAHYLAITYNIKAYEYLKSGDYPKALETIERAIALMPEEANYYDSKGEILLTMGDNQGALEMWNKVMELDPELLSKYPNGTNLYIVLKQKGFIPE